MGTSRTSKRCRPNRGATRALSLSLALLASGCGGGWDTSTVTPTAPRRPDGVALDPPPAIPSPVDYAEARGVVALREPLADKDVEDVVRAYILAFQREDDPTLVQLLAQEAVSLGRQGSTRPQLLEIWRTKMRSFEYQRLAGLEVARLAQMERHTYETLGVPGALPRPPSMRPGDLYVRVPIATPRVGADQLFGDVLVLLLRREDGRLKIAGQADEGGT